MSIFSFTGHILQKLSGKQTIDDKHINKRIQLFINQMKHISKIDFEEGTLCCLINSFLIIEKKVSV